MFLIEYKNNSGVNLEKDEGENIMDILRTMDVERKGLNGGHVTVSQNTVKRTAVNKNKAERKKKIEYALQKMKASGSETKTLTKKQKLLIARVVFFTVVIAILAAVTLGVISIVNFFSNREETEKFNAINTGVDWSFNENVVKPVVPEINAEKIRCSVSCTEGYTRSGEYTREGMVGGKLEWLGRKCRLYEVNKENGERGEVIGEYEFLDTGYGVNGSMEKGESIAVWCPDMSACWDWVDKYGDYVYMEFIEE